MYFFLLDIRDKLSWCFNH